MAVSIRNIVVSVVGVVVLGSWAYSWFANHRANSTVDDGNAEIEKANQYSTQAGAKYTQLTNPATLAAFPGNREQLRPEVVATAELFAQAATAFQSAAAKTEQAGKEGADAVFNEYISVHTQSIRAIGRAKEELGKVVLLFLDPEVKSEADLDRKAESHIKSANALAEQSGALAKRAEEMIANNPSKLRKR